MTAEIFKGISGDELVAVYDDYEATDKFAVGYIVESDENYYVMKTVDRFGKWDGLSCRLVDDIIQVETGDSYLKKIKKLLNYYNEKPIKYAGASENILISFLESALLNRRVCTIELCDSNLDDIIGYIEKVEGDIARITQLSEDGSYNGKINVKIDCISCVSYDSAEERVIEILNKVNFIS